MKIVTYLITMSAIYVFIALMNMCWVHSKHVPLIQLAFIIALILPFVNKRLGIFVGLRKGVINESED